MFTFVNNLLNGAATLAYSMEHEYVTVEHLLYRITSNDSFKKAFKECGGDLQLLRDSLKEYMQNSIEKNKIKDKPTLSLAVEEAMDLAFKTCVGEGGSLIGLNHIMYGIAQANDCYANYYIAIQNVDLENLISLLVDAETGDDVRSLMDEDISSYVTRLEIPGTGFGVILSGFPQSLGVGENAQDAPQRSRDKRKEVDNTWRELVTDLNELVKHRTEPLVGREDIIERTLQVLCRKYKSNVIHLGEPGVGKTAITLGLAQLINDGNVPDNLKGSTIYEIDMGNLLAGTQYRGEFEKKLNLVIEGLQSVEKPIIYIDEIHTIVGAGAGADSNIDASSILKKTLTEGNIKFIGATTYEEYKRYFEKDKALSRRFKTIEVRETSIDETIKIITGIKGYYEDYHNVLYTDDAIKSAVELSDKYINERFLPDKAIDLIDEAGAYISLTRKDDRVCSLGKEKIEEVLSKTCNIPKQTVESSEVDKLYKLDTNLKSVVFGQDAAVDDLVRCIKISRAGLNDDNKPIANMLFVGPTGTGKTELAKALAEKTGVKLIRLDMSEYQEKHTVSKLIGSPAGYVGHEDGGVLTESIRKNPHCVLLLDEIEKAHQDIYNTLLQIMDSATLTDNQGRKADFRNVVIIMTSNAGARDIGRKSIGFNSDDIGSESMDSELKKVFAPEFRNRLTKVIKFKGVDDVMALKIAEKQFKSLKEKVEAKGIKLTVTKKCYKEIASRGTSLETGARQIQRIIDNEVKPILVDEILFGDMKEGTKCVLDYLKAGFKLTVEQQ